LVVIFPNDLARGLHTLSMCGPSHSASSTFSAEPAKCITGAIAMKNPKQQVSHSRREFLREAGVSGGLAAAAVGLPGVALAEAPQGDADQKPEQGYRLTQHILDYYKSAAS
jgi:hypothetical protein